MVGGAIYESAEVLLPKWLRRSRLYRAVVGMLLRIVVEWAGGVKGVFPAGEVDVGKLAARKAAGNAIEVASLLTLGWSPLWLLAAVADLTGGTRAYLSLLVAELRRDGVLPPDADVTSVEELLGVLEETSGLAAETLDVPPLNVDDLRGSWRALQQNAAALPDARRLAGLYAQLAAVAQQEDRSLRSVSALIAIGAARAGKRMGQIYLFETYQQALSTIQREGLPVYARRVSRPYLSAAIEHFDPQRPSGTERLLSRLRRGRRPPGGGE